MTYEEAIESQVTLNEAVGELKRHGFTADYTHGELFDCESGETVARIDQDGMVSGADVLGWLGY